MQRNCMTKEGFENLKLEIQRIQIRLKKEVAEEIATARDKGDLKENAEYDAAKKQVLIHQDGGTRNDPPSLQWLPAFRGFGILFRNRRGERVLRKR